MRSIFILTLLGIAACSIVVWPHLGVLAWTWISYMNPHRLTFGAAQDFPVGMLVGIVTLVAWAFSKEPKEFPYSSLMVLLVIYWVWTTISSAFALNPDWAWAKWTKFSKIMLFTLVTYSLMRSHIRLNALVWVIVISVSFYGLKGGLFTIVTGGSARVWGPPGSFFGDNNAVGLALIMVVPLIRYLQQQIQNRFLNMAFMGWALVTAVAILGTHSRGALVGLGAAVAYMAITSRRIAVFIMIAFTGTAGVIMMPDSWSDRMESILEWDKDASALGRVQMWQYSISVASERPLVGGGFDIFYHAPTIARLAPKDEEGNTVRGRAAHSIYFEVLAEHGYVGLALFLMIGISTLLTARRIESRSRLRPDLKWAEYLAYALQLSLVGYAVTGAFLSLATFDLFYHVVAMTAILQIIVNKHLADPTEKFPPGDPFLSSYFKPKAKKFNPYTKENSAEG